MADSIEIERAAFLEVYQIVHLTKATDGGSLARAVGRLECVTLSANLGGPVDAKDVEAARISVFRNLAHHVSGKAAKLPSIVFIEAIALILRMFEESAPSE